MRLSTHTECVAHRYDSITGLLNGYRPMRAEVAIQQPPYRITAAYLPPFDVKRYNSRVR